MFYIDQVSLIFDHERLFHQDFYELVIYENQL